MPWKCPACGSQIRHSDVEDRPRAGGRYRCHICRLDLVLESQDEKLAVAPLRTDDPDPKPRKSG
jgi:hypothetical protein